MTEKQKRDAGMPYNPNFDAELGKEMLACKDKCFRYNQIPPADLPSQEAMMREILAKRRHIFILPHLFGATMDTTLKSERTSLPITIW